MLGTLPFSEVSAPGCCWSVGEGRMWRIIRRVLQGFHSCLLFLSILGVISYQFLVDLPLCLVSVCSRHPLCISQASYFYVLRLCSCFYWDSFWYKSLYSYTVYRQAELAADSLCSGFQFQVFSSLSLWDLLSRSIDVQNGLIALKSWILLIESILSIYCTLYISLCWWLARCGKIVLFVDWSVEEARSRHTVSVSIPSQQQNA